MSVRVAGAFGKLVDIVGGEFHDLEDRRKRFFFVLTLAILIPALFSFGLFHLLRREFAAGAPVLGLAVLFAALILYCRKIPSIVPSMRLVTACAFLVLLREIVVGGGHGFAFLWIYLFPMAILFSLGTIEGRRWVLVLCVLAGAAFFLSSGHYGAALITRFLVTFTIAVLLSYALESSRAAATQELDKEKAALEDALGQVRTLKGLLPICASCKSIRDDKGYWSQVELYVAERTDAQFTHGICPNCAKKFFPSLGPRPPEDTAGPRTGDAG
jgi:hypothetical protein